MSISCSRGLGKSDCFIDEAVAGLNFEGQKGLMRKKRAKYKARGTACQKRGGVQGTIPPILIYLMVSLRDGILKFDLF